MADVRPCPGCRGRVLERVWHVQRLRAHVLTAGEMPSFVLRRLERVVASPESDRSLNRWLDRLRHWDALQALAILVGIPSEPRSRRRRSRPSIRKPVGVAADTGVRSGSSVMPIRFTRSRPCLAGFYAPGLPLSGQETGVATGPCSTWPRGSPSEIHWKCRAGPLLAP